MENKLFVNNKIEDIEIPKELNGLMRDSIKIGEERLRRKNTRKNFRNGSILIFVLIITFGLNTSAVFATFARDLPLVGKIAESMVFDKGIRNAIENGLYQSLGYSETKNGITLKVPSIAGDYRCLKLEYLIEGIEKNDVRINIIDKEGNDIPVFSSISRSSIDGSADLNSCFEIMFENFVKEFIVVFNIYENQESDVSLAEFEINITLNDKFTDKIENIELTNDVIKTEVGNLVIKDMNSTKTRTYIEMIFESEDYELVSFEKLILIDEKGNEYNIASGFGENIFAVESDLSKAKEITLKSDAIYYLSKKNRTIKVDLKNKELVRNDYNLKLASNEEIERMGLYKNLEKNMIVFEASETPGFSLRPNDNMIWIRTNMITISGKEEGLDEYIRGSVTYVLYETLTHEDEIEVEIDAIYSNRTKSIKTKIK